MSFRPTLQKSLPRRPWDFLACKEILAGPSWPGQSLGFPGYPRSPWQQTEESYSYLKRDQERDPSRSVGRARVTDDGLMTSLYTRQGSSLTTLGAVAISTGLNLQRQCAIFSDATEYRIFRVLTAFSIFHYFFIKWIMFLKNEHYSSRNSVYIYIFIIDFKRYIQRRNYLYKVLVLSALRIIHVTSWQAIGSRKSLPLILIIFCRILK